ncbi:MAG: hypothetical protein ACI9XU_001449 [Arenicella sp.]|jgi:hypothetical protein
MVISHHNRSKDRIDWGLDRTLQTTAIGDDVNGVYGESGGYVFWPGPNGIVAGSNQAPDRFA